MSSESTANSAFGLMGYWLRAHSGSRNNCQTPVNRFTTKTNLGFARNRLCYVSPPVCYCFRKLLKSKLQLFLLILAPSSAIFFCTRLSLHTIQRFSYLAIRWSSGYLTRGLIYSVFPGLFFLCCSVVIWTRVTSKVVAFVGLRQTLVAHNRFLFVHD